MSLTGKTALVTGASRGLGRAIACDLVARGATVWGIGRDTKALEKLAAEIAEQGGQFHPVTLDLRNESAIVDCIARMPALDLVINNAGVAAFAKASEATTESLVSMLEINVVAPFIVLRESIRRMAGGPGFIISIASDAALHGIAGMSTYCATKHALLGFDRSVREELRGTRIRLTTVCPGPIKTEILGPASLAAAGASPASVARMIGDIASLPEDVTVPEVVLQPGV